MGIKHCFFRSKTPLIVWNFQNISKYFDLYQIDESSKTNFIQPENSISMSFKIQSESIYSVIVLT